jgi:hypothetical protein
MYDVSEVKVSPASVKEVACAYSITVAIAADGYDG